MTEVMEAAGKRNTGLDLLRVLCMLAIVMLHYLYSADALLWSEPAAQGALPPSETVRTLGTLLYCFAICLVNPFVIMSGYLLYDRAFSLRRFFELLCTVVFFGIGVQLVMTLVTGEGPSGAYEWVQALFPVSSRHYWFMTSYLFMYPFAPLVVTGTRAFDKKQLRMLIAIAVVFLSLIKSIVPVRFVTDEGGYNVAWFLLLVLIGAYLRKYEDDGFLAGARSLFWYVICALAIFVLTVGVRTLTISGGGFLTLFEILRDYNFILCLAAGVGIFVFFKDLPLL